MTPWEAIVLNLTIVLLVIAGVTTYNRHHPPVLPAFVRPACVAPVPLLYPRAHHDV